MSAFEELGVLPEIINALEEMGWMIPTPIQAESIPLMLGGGDIMAAAETGSGKTGAFAIPLLQLAHEILRGVGNKSQRGNNKKRKTSSIRVLLNNEDREPLLNISSDGLVCQNSAERTWAGCRANCGVQYKGKYCWEIQITSAKQGIVRVGWSSIAARHNLGTDKHGFGYGGTGKKAFDNIFDNYGGCFKEGDTVMCFLDLNINTISYSVNGYNKGVAFNIPNHLKGQVLYPALTLKQSTVKVNFGDSSFHYPPLNEFIGVSKAELLVGQDENITETVETSTSRSPIGLILEPTKELAEQVYDEIQKCKKYLNHPKISHNLLVGGIDSNWYSGTNDIIVGTIGKIMGFVNQKKLNLMDTKIFLIDEADRFLDLGAQKDILSLYKIMSKKNNCQIGMFSATLHSHEITELSQKITHNPQWVDLKGKDSIPDTVDHVILNIDPLKNSSDIKNYLGGVITDRVHSKVNLQANNPSSISESVKIIKILKLVEIINAFKMEQSLIFARTKLDCDNIEKYLISLGGGQAYRGRMETGKENIYSCVVLHGDRSIDERRRNFKAFKDGDVRFLICTDVAARGLDVSQLPFIINVTLPDKSEDYIHRVGRVGRQDCMGLAISLVSNYKEKVWYHSCPSRGKNCHNTQLANDGGCCIWYNEPQYLNDIEKRLGGQKLSLLDPNNLIKGYDIKSKYGRQKKDEISENVRVHIKNISLAVKDLLEVEDITQKCYWDLKQKYKAL